MKSLICLFFLCLITFSAKATLPQEIYWSSILSESQLVIRTSVPKDQHAVLVRVKVEAVYKGVAQVGDSIWITVDRTNDLSDSMFLFLEKCQSSPVPPPYFDQWAKRSGLSERGVVDYWNAIESGQVYQPFSWYHLSILEIHNNDIRCDLASAYIPEGNCWSANEFDRFLSAYYLKQAVPEFCANRIKQLSKQNEFYQRQSLVMLEQLKYNRYESVFGELHLTEAESKIALADLLAYVESENAVGLLCELAKDTANEVWKAAISSLTYQSLQNRSSAKINEFLVSQLPLFDPKSEVNYDSILRPHYLLKQIDTLRLHGLVPKLRTWVTVRNFHVFEQVVVVLNHLQDSSYIQEIRQRLDVSDPSFDPYKLIVVDRLIYKYRLTACLPSVHRFLETCSPELYAKSHDFVAFAYGIGGFTDSINQAFLLRDFANLLAGKHQIASGDQKKWIKEYLSTFSQLKLKESKALIYDALFSWFGISEDFGKNPSLFNSKHDLEKRFRSDFDTQFASTGYKLNDCLAYITNTEAVDSGEKAKAVFMVDISVPDTDHGEQYIDSFAVKLNLPRELVFVRYSNAYYKEVQERFHWVQADFLISFLATLAEIEPNESLLAIIDYVRKHPDAFFTADYQYNFDRLYERLKG